MLGFQAWEVYCYLIRDENINYINSYKNIIFGTLYKDEQFREGAQKFKVFIIKIENITYDIVILIYFVTIIFRNLKINQEGRRQWAVYYTSPQSLETFINLISCFFKLSVQTFQPLIVLYRRNNLVYYWRCTSVKRPLFNPFRSQIIKSKYNLIKLYSCKEKVQL